MKKIPAWLACDPIAIIDPQWLAGFLDSAETRHANVAAAMTATFGQLDVKAAESAFRQMLRQELAPKAKIGDDGYAIVPIQGPIAYAPDIWEMIFDGVEDSRSIVAMVNSVASNHDVRGALLDINSPGGMVTGGTEIADAVAAMSKRKPVVAWSGGMMSSLAYMIASQAREIITSKSASVGSIGTIITFPDVSKAFEMLGIKMEVITNKEAVFKGAGAPGTSLTDPQRDYLQSRAQSAFDEFKRTVNSKRSVPDEAMRGQVFWGKEARANGLVDRLGDMGFAMSVLKAAKP